MNRASAPQDSGQLSQGISAISGTSGMPRRFLEITGVNDIPGKVLLCKFSGSEGISTLFNYQLEFVSTAAQLETHILLAHPIGVSINQQQQPPQYFHGLVQTIKCLGRDYDDYYRYEMSLMPWFGFLQYNQDSQSFVKQSVPEIIKSVLERSDVLFTDYSGLSNSYPELDYCVRYNESAFAFLSRLMEQQGIYYYFRHEQNQHYLVLEDGLLPSSAYAAALEYQNERGGDAAHLYTWQSERKISLGNLQARAANINQPRRPLKAKQVQAEQSQAKNAIPLKNTDHYHYETQSRCDRNHSSATLAKQLQRQSRRNLLDAIDITTSGNYAGLYAGMQISISSEDANVAGDYYIHAMQHHAFDHSHRGHHVAQDNDNAEQAEQGYSHELKLYGDNNYYAPALKTPNPQLAGMLPALVVGPADIPIYSNGHAEIKLQMHWDRQGLLNQTSSRWVRVQQSLAGNQFGSQFLPRVGQEILVQFADGHPDNPSVVCSYYNAAHSHPFNLETQSGIKTQSLGNADNSEDNSAGHELRFDDTTGKEQLYLKSQKDQAVYIKGQSEKHINQHSNITIDCGDYSALVNGVLKVKAAESLTLHVGTSKLILDKSGVNLFANTVSVDHLMVPMLPKQAAQMQALPSIAEAETNGNLLQRLWQVLDIKNDANESHGNNDQSDNGEKNNIDKQMFPKVTIAINKTLKENVKDFGAVIRTEKFEISGKFTMERLNAVEPAKFDHDKILLEAEQNLSKYFYGVKLTDVSIARREVTIGGSNLSDDYKVELNLSQETPESIEYTAEFTLKILSKKQNNWHIEGAANFKIILIITKKPETMTSVVEEGFKKYLHHLELEYLTVGTFLFAYYKITHPDRLTKTIELLPFLPKSAFAEDAVEIFATGAEAIMV